MLLTSGALAFGAAACGDDDEPEANAPAAQAEKPAASGGGSVEEPQPVTGGSTILDLDDRTAGVLDLAGVEIEPVGEATAADGRFEFPITSGSVDIDTLSGEIEHEGGLRFTAGGRSVDATDFVIRPGEDVLTAEVAGRRLPLMEVDLKQLEAPTSGSIVLPGSTATLAPDAVAALEDRLGVPLPESSLPLGRVEVSAEG